MYKRTFASPSRVYDTPTCQLEIPTTIEEKLGGGMSTRASHTLTPCRSRCPRAKDARSLFCQVSLTFPLSASSLLQPCLHICTPGSKKEKQRVQAFQTRILVKSSLSFLSCIFLFIGECRPQMFVEVCSRLPLCGSRDLNSGCQTGWQKPSLAEPSCWPITCALSGDVYPHFMAGE